MDALSPLRLTVSMAAFFLVFAALPQALGYVVNRLLRRWQIASRILGAVLPVIAITAILAWVSEREVAAVAGPSGKAGGGHGVAFLFLGLVPMHVVFALMLQSELAYGTERHPNQPTA